MTIHIPALTTDDIASRADRSIPCGWCAALDVVAHFTVSGDWTDDGTPSARRFWQEDCTLIGLTIGAHTFDRATTLDMIGAALVDEWEVEAAE